MILISHRGNTNGPRPEFENKPIYLEYALTLGYEVEADVWWDTGWWLGHDRPQYRTTLDFLGRCWCHAKNIEAFAKLNDMEGIITFWHTTEPYVLTSLGDIWVHPGARLIKDSICVLPEIKINGFISNCSGICSDYVRDYQYVCVF